MGLTANRATETVYLFTTEDRHKLDELARDLDNAAAAKEPRRVGGSPSVQDAADAYDTFLAEAKERATQVHLTALRKPMWRAMLADHPPRKDVTDDEGVVLESFPADKARGFNVDTLADSLVPASIDDGQFDGGTLEQREQERQEYVDDLDDPAFSQFYSAAVRLNTTAGPDPKWSASSWLARTSVETSSSDESSDSE